MGNNTESPIFIQLSHFNTDTEDKGPSHSPDAMPCFVQFSERRWQAGLLIYLILKYCLLLFDLNQNILDGMR